MVVTGEGIFGDRNDSEWAEANVRVAQLHNELSQASDPAARLAIETQLQEARETIARIEADWDGEIDAGAGPDPAAGFDASFQAEPTGPSEIDDLLAELLTDADLDADTDLDTDTDAGIDEIERSLPAADVLEEAITTDRARIFGVTGGHDVPLAIQGPGRDRGSVGLIDGPRPAPRSSQPPVQSRPHEPEPEPLAGVVLRTIGVFALAAVVGTGAAIWLSSLGQGDEAPSTSEPAAVETSQTTDANGTIGEGDELESVLAIFGFDDVQVVRDGQVIRLSGTVANAADLRVVRETARALDGDVEVDTNGLQLAQLPSGVSESSSANSPAADQPDSTLQRDLDRLLATTPVRFDANGRGLGELDRRILNAVAALIRASPAVTVTVVGHADAGVDDPSLATDRAQRVQEYLVDQGVSVGLLRASAGEASVQDGSGHIELVISP